MNYAQDDIFFNNKVEKEPQDEFSDTVSLRSDDEELKAFLSDEDESNLQFPTRSKNLPEYACSFCEIHNPTCVIKCNTCNKWFCNSKTNGGRSHIVTHLIMSRHNEVSLHELSDLGNTTLECYNCGNKNVFILGFVSLKDEAYIVILCRLPCAQAKDSTWDTAQWQSLIDDKHFLPWVALIPSEEEQINAVPITSQQIVQLEAKWRSNRDATFKDLNEDVDDEELLPILMRYNDAYEYQRSFAPLVKLEADYDKLLKESQGLEHLSVKWGLGLNNRHLISFALSTFESGGLKIAVGDEVIIRHQSVDSVPWEGHGIILKLPNSHQEEFTMELNPTKKKPPTDHTTGFNAEFLWKGTSYDRMQRALRMFAVDSKSVSGYIYHKLLGHDVAPVEFDMELPLNLNIPNTVPLNNSQMNAVRTVLQKPFSLIQGPPGTGKTVTSLAIIYHLSKLNKEKILVCASSNVAVDHLTAKLGALNLNVVRLMARSREDVDSSISHLLLHSMSKKKSKKRLRKLMALKEALGELSLSDSQEYSKLILKQEIKTLKDADIVCTTCVGAGDARLSSINFKTVLIDESTQASEPECLIPIVKGVKQVILVGDHQQLGPVILDRKAADAGLKQSLFERLVVLGHIPIRLEVQYRMNPYLSEFPSNMFYEGSLQNGVTTEQRTLVDSSFPWPINNIPMMFWSNFGREEISASGTSYLNRIEAMNCEKIVTTLFKDGIKPSQIGIVTPYEGQRTFVVQFMQLNGALKDKSLYEDVEVTSVDGFQGREKDFIIFSCVRANDKQLIGFLNDPRRLNVALTRAKYGLILLGSPRALSRNPLWNHLLNHYREKGCLVEGPLENLQLCTIQLQRPVYDNYKQKNITLSSTNSFKDFDTESIASYAPESVSGGRRKNYNTNGRDGLPPIFDTKQWPALNSITGDDGNSDTDTINNDEPDYYNRNNAPQIDSSFSSKLLQLNQQTGQNDAGGLNDHRIENDIRSLSSSFAGQFGLH